MEPRVTINLRLEEEEPQRLSDVPVNFEELCNAVYRTTGAVQFKIKFRDHVIVNDEQLFTAYLENREDSIEFLIDEDLQSTGYVGSSVENLSKHLAKPQGSGPKLTVTNGVVTKEDLLRIINSMTDAAQAKLVASNREFMIRRQEFYEKDLRKWQEVAFEQLGFQERLLMSITGEVCHSYGINPQVFQDSCRTHARTREVNQALEEMATKTLQAGVELPASLTREKMREVMEYVCNYLDNFLRDNPPRNPADLILLKIREGDEVMKTFGYDENEIATGLTQYGIDTADEWADIRDRLQNVMAKAFNPQNMPMGGGMMPPY